MAGAVELARLAAGRPALAERVVHLGDDAGHAVVAAAAPVEADRVEDVAERARVREQLDAPAVAGRRPRRRGRRARSRRSRPRVAEVIGGAHARRGWRRSLPRESEAAVQLVELVEIEQQLVDAVAEGVAAGGSRACSSTPVVEGRPHGPAARIASAAAQPPRSRPRGSPSRGTRRRSACGARRSAPRRRSRAATVSSV